MERRFVEPEKFLDCVHCGLCLSACPTYLELGTEMDSPRGRIYLMRGLEDGNIELTADVVRHLDLCLGCRACETACPSGVQYGELIESARAYVETTYKRGLFDRLRRRLISIVFPNPALLSLLLAPVRLLQRAAVWGWVERFVPLSRMLPTLAHRQALPPLAVALDTERYRVGMLSGCVAQVIFTNVNQATVRVLQRNGCTVMTPPAQGCCGALHMHAGDRDKALACARYNVGVFSDPLDAIVVNAAGCGAMLKQYGELLQDDPELAEPARQFSARVRDVNEWLASIPLQAPSDSIEARVTYHDACHLAHGQGVRQAPRQLLRSIPGVELVELAESDVCCGSAGSYNLTEPEMAHRLGARKANHVTATGAACVAVANPGCAMQIKAALRAAGSTIEVRHPVELLDAAYGDSGSSEMANGLRLPSDRQSGNPRA